MPRRLEPLYTRSMSTHRPNQPEIVLRNKEQYVEEPLIQLIFPYGITEGRLEKTAHIMKKLIKI